MTPAEFKQARQSLGLSRAEAATALGYGAVTRISEIENGERVPIQAEIIMRLLLERAATTTGDAE